MKRYKLCLETEYKDKIIKTASNYDIVVIDAQDYTNSEIKAIKSSGAKVLTYINVGAIESDRPYFKDIKAKGLLICEYDNWDGEWWVSADNDAWYKHISSLSKSLLEKGIDGFWVDNLDVYYMADEEWKWSSTKKNTLYIQLKKILKDLHDKGYVMVNGGDVFVSRLIKEDTKYNGTGIIDAINQETVFSCITNYSGDGSFGKQLSEDKKYYQEYIKNVSKHKTDVFLLEYTRDNSIIEEAKKYCEDNGYTLCVSSTIRLGGDIINTTSKTETSNAITTTVWDVLSAFTKYDGSPTAHEDVITTLKAHGHSPKESDAWCTQTIMAAFYDAGAIGLIGGYTQLSATVKKNAEKLGIYHSGSSGILPGDIVIFGENGKPNHSEFAVGDNVDISGNYNNGCSRRSRNGRHIMGYVRPKYAAMNTMNNLQMCISACDVILGVYGKTSTRTKNLSVFGTDNANKIQNEVNRIWGDTDKIIFNMAVYTIAGHAGKNTYRTKRLSSYASATQKKINDIYNLKGKSTEQAVRYILDGKFGNGEIRTLLLKFCGYDSDKVQKAVNAYLLEEPKKAQPNSGSRIRVWPIWFFEKDEGLFGDCTAIVEYGADDKTVEHCILIDAAKASASSLVLSKLKTAGVKKIDAFVMSHAHGDHYGGLSNIMNSMPVGEIYVPDTAGLEKYQPEYAKAVKRQASKFKTAHFLKAGDSFTIGNINCKCLYQAPASSLSEHDDHHFVNNQSMVLRFTLNGIWTFHTAGDLQNEGNNLLIRAVSNLNADIFKCQWHGDANACNESICKAVKPKVAFSNYHHKERSGRGTTRSRLESVGAVVARNSENGDIYIDCSGNTMKLSCSKNNLSKTFTK